MPVRRAFAVEGILDASGVRENAAGRRNERRSRSTPRTIRDSGRAKGWSPAAFERGQRKRSAMGSGTRPDGVPEGEARPPRQRAEARGQSSRRWWSPERLTLRIGNRLTTATITVNFFRLVVEQVEMPDAARVTETGTVGAAVAYVDGKMIATGSGRRRSTCRQRRAAKADGGGAARVRHRDRRGARTGSLWKLEIGRTDASGPRSGGRRRRWAVRSACPARMRSIEPAADGDEDAAPEISSTGSWRRGRRSGR